MTRGSSISIVCLGFFLGLDNILFLHVRYHKESHFIKYVKYGHFKFAQSASALATRMKAAPSFLSIK